MSSRLPHLSQTMNRSLPKHRPKVPAIAFIYLAMVCAMTLYSVSYAGVI
jgi:hypothetical protein